MADSDDSATEMEMVGARVPADVHSRMESWRDDREISSSEAIRRLIRRGLDAEEQVAEIEQERDALREKYQQAQERNKELTTENEALEEKVEAERRRAQERVDELEEDRAGLQERVDELEEQTDKFNLTPPSLFGLAALGVLLTGFPAPSVPVGGFVLDRGGLALLLGALSILLALRDSDGREETDE